MPDESLTELPRDFEPGGWDVICGRGKRCYNSPGNQRLRQMVKARKDEYRAATCKREKSLIVSSVVEEIHKANGQFVKDVSGRWYKLDGFYPREKIAHAFRDVISSEFCAAGAARVWERQEKRKRLRQAIGEARSRTSKDETRSRNTQSTQKHMHQYSQEADGQDHHDCHKLDDSKSSNPLSAYNCSRSRGQPGQRRFGTAPPGVYNCTFPIHRMYPHLFPYDQLDDWIDPGCTSSVSKSTGFHISTVVVQGHKHDHDDLSTITPSEFRLAKMSLRPEDLLLHQIRFAAASVRTDPSLTNIMIMGVAAFLGGGRGAVVDMMSTEDSMVDYPSSSLASLMEEQNEIGWDRFLEGILSHKWRQFQAQNSPDAEDDPEGLQWQQMFTTTLAVNYKCWKATTAVTKGGLKKGDVASDED